MIFICFLTDLLNRNMSGRLTSMLNKSHLGLIIQKSSVFQNHTGRSFYQSLALRGFNVYNGWLQCTNVYASYTLVLKFQHLNFHCSKTWVNLDTHKEHPKFMDIKCYGSFWGTKQLAHYLLLNGFWIFEFMFWKLPFVVTCVFLHRWPTADGFYGPTKQKHHFMLTPQNITCENQGQVKIKGSPHGEFLKSLSLFLSTLLLQILLALRLYLARFWCHWSFVLQPCMLSVVSATGRDFFGLEWFLLSRA